MKHVRDMSHRELVGLMLPEARARFLSLSPEEQRAFVDRIAEAQDQLHEDAVASSWFKQGYFYK